MQSSPARADVAQRVKQRSRTMPPLRGLICSAAYIRLKLLNGKPTYDVMVWTSDNRGWRLDLPIVPRSRQFRPVIRTVGGHR